MVRFSKVLYVRCMSWACAAAAGYESEGSCYSWVPTVIGDEVWEPARWVWAVWSRKRQPLHSSEEEVQGPRPKRMRKQNKAITGKGMGIRKVETEDYRDETRAAEPGNSNNSTKPGFPPGILNPHFCLLAANIWETSQRWCVFSFLVTAPCKGYWWYQACTR